MQHDLGPHITDAHIVVSLTQLVLRRQLGVESGRHLVDKADTLVVSDELLDGHGAIEDVNDLLVVYPCEHEVTHLPAVGFLELLPQVIQPGAVSHLDAEFVVLVVLVNRVLHEEAVHLHILHVDDGHRDHEERVEGDADALAARASELRLVLAMEQVADDALVAEDVLVPRFARSFLVTLAIGLGLLDVGFLLTLVQVFRNEVKHRVDALLTVMLAIALEGDVVLSHGVLN